MIFKRLRNLYRLSGLDFSDYSTFKGITKEMTNESGAVTKDKWDKAFKPKQQLATIIHEKTNYFTND